MEFNVTSIYHRLELTRFLPVIEAAIIVFVTYVILLIVKLFLTRLQRREYISSYAVEQIHRLLSLILYSTTAITILYMFTSAREVFYIIVVAFAAILFSNWQLISNLTAYYVMLLSRHTLRSAALIELPQLNVKGKVVDMTPLHTKIRSIRGEIIYVPNASMLSKVVLHHTAVQTTISLDISVSLKNEASLAGEQLAEIEKLVRKGLEASKSIPRIQDVVIRVKSIENRKVNLSVTVPVTGAEPRPATVNNIIAHLYDALRDRDPSIHVVS